ncbi:MAG: hypothetical protein JNM85_09855 [Chthonomonas sp.]|nr:hypothetical protein [Chthonomonas sp.]
MKPFGTMSLVTLGLIIASVGFGLRSQAGAQSAASQFTNPGQPSFILSPVSDPDTAAAPTPIINERVQPAEERIAEVRIATSDELRKQIIEAVEAALKDLDLSKEARAKLRASLEKMDLKLKTNLRATIAPNAPILDAKAMEEVARSHAGVHKAFKLEDGKLKEIPPEAIEEMMKGRLQMLEELPVMKFEADRMRAAAEEMSKHFRSMAEEMKSAQKGDEALRSKLEKMRKDGKLKDLSEAEWKRLLDKLNSASFQLKELAPLRELGEIPVVPRGKSVAPRAENTSLQA